MVDRLLPHLGFDRRPGAHADVPRACSSSLRMAIAAALVGLVFARRPMLAEVRAPATAALLLVIGLFSAATLLLFFIALRLTGRRRSACSCCSRRRCTSRCWRRGCCASARPRRLPGAGRRTGGHGGHPAARPCSATHDVSKLGVACGVGGRPHLRRLRSSITKRLTRTVAQRDDRPRRDGLDAVLLLPLAVWQVVDAGYSSDGAGPRRLLVLGGGLHGHPLRALRRGHAPRSASSTPRSSATSSR